MHIIMVVDSIAAAAAETGVQTVNQHHGIIMLAATKVRETKQKEQKKTIHTSKLIVRYTMFYFPLHFFFARHILRENKQF